MAFTLQHSWHFVEERPCGPPLSESPLLGPLVRSGIGGHARRGFGTMLTVGVHILLFAFLLSRLNAPSADPAPPKAAPMTFQLTTAAAEGAPRTPTPTPPQPPAATPQPSPVDTTTPSELPAPEWTVSRIAVRGTQAPGAAAVGNYGPGGAGTAVYDPFAGAAPLRLDGAASKGLAFNAAALAAVKGRVERRLASCRGSVLLSVQVSPSGQVTQAEVRGGSAPADAKAALQRETLGKRLFVGAAGAPERRDLPEVRFCA